jgi:hypothetical protein
MHKKSSLVVFTAMIILFAVCIGPAAAYSNYEYIWTSSGNQFLEEGSIPDISLGPYHYPDSYSFTVKPSLTPVVITPFVNSGNKNGVRPKVRYLWFALYMDVGVKANYIQVFSGAASVYSHSIDWEGTGAYKEYILDMGSYKDVNRGINTALSIYNSNGVGEGVAMYGAGAREEW